MPLRLNGIRYSALLEYALTMGWEIKVVSKAVEIRMSHARVQFEERAPAASGTASTYSPQPCCSALSLQSPANGLLPCEIYARGRH